MGRKRKIDFDEDAFNEEVKQVRITLAKQKRELHLFSNICTQFLPPAYPALCHDPRPFFAKRGYRTIIGHKATAMRIPDDLEIHILLLRLQERYAKEEKSEPHQTKSHWLSRKEKSLLDAAGYLYSQTLSYAMISKLTSLTPYEVAALDKRMRTTGQIFPNQTGRKCRLSTEHVEYLKDLLDNHVSEFWTLQKIRKNLLQTFDNLNTCSISTLSNTLNKNGYSYKKLYSYVEVRNTEANKVKVKAAVRELIVALSKPHQVIFVDETSVKLNLIPRYGWGKKGKKIALKRGAVKKSYTIATAITDSRVLGCMIFEGGVKAVDYTGFLCTIIDEFEQAFKPKKIIIFHDGAPSHKAQFVKNVLESQVNFILNGPYCPMLNAIEEFFAKFKLLIKRESCDTRDELVRAVQKTFLQFKPSDFKGYVRNTLRSCSAVLEGEDLI